MFISPNISQEINNESSTKMTQEIQNQSSTNETFVSDDHHECQECSKNFKERNILEDM